MIGRVVGLIAALAVLAVLAVFFFGCAPKAGQAVIPAAPFVTKETGELTIERERFVTMWAQTQVLFDAWIAHERFTCAGPCRDAERCAKLPDIAEQGKAIKLTVDSKLRNPEATIDWANVAKLLGLIAKMVL